MGVIGFILCFIGAIILLFNDYKEEVVAGCIVLGLGVLFFTYDISSPVTSEVSYIRTTDAEVYLLDIEKDPDEFIMVRKVKKVPVYRGAVLRSTEEYELSLLEDIDAEQE